MVNDGYGDFSKPTFNKGKDKIIIITDVLSKADVVDGLAMLDWARAAKDHNEFINKINHNKTKRTKYNFFEKALKEKNTDILGEDIWWYIRSIHLRAFDYLETEVKTIKCSVGS